MIQLGAAARRLRKMLGITQREAARLLEISVVYLCNIEQNRATPSQHILDRYRELWGVDLYVLSWCDSGHPNQLPPALRKSAQALAAAWKRELDAIVKRHKQKAS